MNSSRICAALAAALLAACSAETEKAPPLLPPVIAAQVAALDFEVRIDAPGELQALYHTIIAAEVSGRITQIRAPEGAPVARDQVVQEIDPERRQLELAAARARAAQAEASLTKERRQAERVRELFRNSVASKARLDEVETAVQLAEARRAAERAQLGVAQRAVDDASVNAPFAGLIARRLVSVGEFVQPGTPLFELVSLDPIEVVFHLSEVDSGRVRVGQQVAVSVAPHPGEVFRGRVTMVSPTIDRRTRTLRVKAEIPNTDRRLRPGLFAHTDLGLNPRKGVVMVPEEALLQRSDGTIVFKLVASGRVRRLVVRTGVEHDGWVEVLDHLAPGERVIWRGHAGLIDGAEVTLRERDGGPDETAVASGHSEEEAGL